jgi:dienelactone hydrolase
MRIVSLVALLALAGAANAQRPAPGPAKPPGVIGAPAGTGAHPAVAEVKAELPAHTLYRPSVLPSGRMPIVIWGNGGCADNGLSASHFLREVASHGYLVVAAGHARTERPSGPPPALLPPPAKPVVFNGPGAGRDETRTSDVLSGLDWALAENQRRGSALYGALDAKRVAVMGHSCGGLQAIDAAADPRMRTAVIFNSGIYKRDTTVARDGVALDKTALAKLHTPIAYINGGPTDIAYSASTDDFARLKRVPAFYAALPVGHGGTFAVANGGEYARLAVAWLNWQLRGDRNAAKWFTGANCKLCTDTRWPVERKRLD